MSSMPSLVHAADMFDGEILTGLVTARSWEPGGIHADFGDGVRIASAVQGREFVKDPTGQSEILPLEVHLENGVAFTVISYAQAAFVAGW